MATMPFHKYRPFPAVQLPERRWPSRIIGRAPTWCSVDLRDGNQALREPMGPERKLRMFDTLVEMGFSEIEVGFPAASQADFEFVRLLIEEDRIPEDVTIQVLVPAREALIHETFSAIRGASRVIVHLYNSTSPVQRRLVFGLGRAGIVEIAARGAQCIRDLAELTPATQFTFQYSPESFSATELDFSLDICEAVLRVWQPTPEKKVILNLPSTVEVSTPNVYADQIEWFARCVSRRDSIVLSVHPHNDRGTGAAAAELALLAGAERVEGSLFGNGERTGNVDLVTLAMNLHAQGIDPQLDLTDIDAVRRVAEYCTRIPVHPRHPYVGEFVYTAFSGSHQDAIRKGLVARSREGDVPWEVPYLPIDPADVGRSYEAVIRINSQSGKGGVAYVLEQDHGFRLPRQLQIEFSRVVQEVTDGGGGELSSAAIRELFEKEYLHGEGGFRLLEHSASPQPDERGKYILQATVQIDGTARTLRGAGNGPIDAFTNAAGRALGVALQVTDYSEHALGGGADAIAAAYVELTVANGAPLYGVGLDPSIVTASLQAVASALNRALRQKASAAA